MVITTKYIDYIWLDSERNLRTKKRILYFDNTIEEYFNSVPEWNYDGSSTGQASIEGNTEIILKPIFTSTNENDPRNIIALCDIFDINGNPLSHRKAAEEYFTREEVLKENPWFGLEQEFFLIPKSNFSENYFTEISNKNEYCSTNRNYTERCIINNFVTLCHNFNITLSGVNSEVSPHQWEFQLFGKGLNICDQLYIARFILETIAERYTYTISYLPKINSNVSGSGCHVNFSTTSTRTENTGYNVIEQYIKRFEKNHMKIIECCSQENKERLSGKYETAKWDTFSWGIGTRNTSIRVPNDTFKNNCGYLEDRRPGADIDPYLYCMTMCKIALNN